MAGFSPEQEHAIQAAAAASRLTHWVCGPLAGADAWVINGQCAQHLGDGRIRIASRQAGGRSVHLQLSRAQRPVAFSLPVPANLHGVTSFDVGAFESILEAIGVFEFVLAAEAARFLLAGHIVDQQDVLSSGTYELRAKGQLIAVVDMRGDACVLPSVRPANFDIAVWTRANHDRMRVPQNFARASLALLMWRYVSRSPRDLLPVRYRTGSIYFRRPPRIDPVLVDEEHLLVMRELAIRPASYDELKARLDMQDVVLARTLAALYYVGSITANRLRAGPTPVAGELARASRDPSRYAELRSSHVPFEVTELRHLTAPAPLTFA
jgi:DNA-binding transcriptional ArsR family regulator